MIDTFTFEAGPSPLLVSVPHDGRQLPCDIAGDMTGIGRKIPDTDWHVARLYEFARELGASILRAEYSRYVVDLNRSPDDEALYAGRFGTGLCPSRTFGGEDIYRDGAPIDTAARVAAYWRPYHDTLAAALAGLREQHGYALLWDAHSIPSRVPALFDGELPELNVGTWDGRSCGEPLAEAVFAAAAASPYSAVRDARFKGGYITRHYGEPGENVHAVQLELAQRCYMDEASQNYDTAKASGLRVTLASMLEAYIESARREHGRRG